MGAAFGFERAFAAGGLVRVTIFGAGGARIGSDDLKLTMTGPTAMLGSTKAGGNGKGAAGLSGIGAAGAGASTMRRSGTSTRLSCQGKAKPGRPTS